MYCAIPTIQKLRLIKLSQKGVPDKKDCFKSFEGLNKQQLTTVFFLLLIAFFRVVRVGGWAEGEGVCLSCDYPHSPYTQIQPAFRLYFFFL